MNPNHYYYRTQACIVYRQPVGRKAFSEADLAIWTSSCAMAERLVAELERLRMENLELQEQLNQHLTGDKHGRAKAVQH